MHSGNWLPRLHPVYSQKRMLFNSLAFVVFFPIVRGGYLKGACREPVFYSCLLAGWVN